APVVISRFRWSHVGCPLSGGGGMGAAAKNRPQSARFDLASLTPLDHVIPPPFECRTASSPPAASGAPGVSPPASRPRVFRPSRLSPPARSRSWGPSSPRRRRGWGGG